MVCSTNYAFAFSNLVLVSFRPIQPLHWITPAQIHVKFNAACTTSKQLITQHKIHNSTTYI